MNWGHNMNNNNQLLKTIFTVSFLTIAVIAILLVIASKITSLLTIQNQKSVVGIAIIIALSVALINWRFCYEKLNNIVTKVYQLDKWCYDNSTFCFFVGLFSGLMSIAIFMQILFSLKNFYLTMVQGFCLLFFLFMTSLMIPAFEKKFGPL